MGTGNPKPQRRIAPETGLEPHFHVTDATYELQADGTILVSIYEERRGELKLQCTATVMPQNLSRMSGKAQRTAADAHNYLTFSDVLGSGGKDH